MSKPLVSVVIPCYKAEKYLSETIDSLYAQKKVNLQIIAVEDGVFDNTAKILENYPQIEHMQFAENRGAQKARNTGLAKVKSDYVMFLDSDDYHEGELLYGLYKSLEDSGASIAFGKLKKIYENSKKERWFLPPKNETNLEVLERWLLGFSGPNPSAILWRTSELQRIGAWNEQFHRNQDGELVIRAMFNDCTVTQSYEGHGVYRLHNQSSVSKDMSEKTFKSQELLEMYIKSQIKLKQEYKFLIKPLGKWIFNNAMIAYKYNQFIIGKKWEKKWIENGKYGGYSGQKKIKQIISYIAYKIFGLKNAIALFKKINKNW